MPRQILVVEDNDFMRKFITAALSSGDHDVASVASIDDASRFLANSPDANQLCVIVDVFLDHESGIDFGEATARRFPGIRVLLISAFTDHVMVLDPGITTRMAFLRKPFTSEELAAAIEGLGR
jgi:DNA-binding NtrC family response regulator